MSVFGGGQLVSKFDACLQEEELMQCSNIHQNKELRKKEKRNNSNIMTMVLSDRYLTALRKKCGLVYLQVLNNSS